MKKIMSKKSLRKALFCSFSLLCVLATLSFSALTSSAVPSLSPAIELMACENTYYVSFDNEKTFTKWVFDRAVGTHCSSITILSLPQKGVLTLSGKEVSFGQIIPRKELKNLRYSRSQNSQQSCEDVFVFGSMVGDLGVITNLFMVQE